MNEENAIQLEERLEKLNQVTANVVHFSKRDAPDHTVVNDSDKHPDDDLYGVQFYAYDSMIPQDIIDIVADANTQGIYIHPDPGIVLPAPN